MTDLPALGWTDFFADQVRPNESAFIPARIASVHRARLSAITETGPLDLSLPPHTSTADYAVGDWVLANPETDTLHRRLDRLSVLGRRPEGSRATQLAAANLDTLFIVTSCNADFNIARLERYLALANQAEIAPVIVLTKADTTPDAADYEQQARALQRDLPIVTVNAPSSDAAKALAPWCGISKTVALVGSSGVGKSTLVNTLAGLDYDQRHQKTGAVRETDAKGRHTTTSRSLHAIVNGGWIIDTPGIRTLHVSEVGEGIDTLFAEITELAPLCKFRDCTHSHEPGCAVQKAIAAGTLDPDRLTRWRKLHDENQFNAPAPKRR